MNTLRTILTGLNTLITFNRFRADQRENLVIALTSLRRAIRATRTQIDSDGYVSSHDVSDLWLNSFEAFRRARLQGEQLYNKARFWEAPRDWLNEPISMELIPTLNDLEKVCDELLVKIGA